MRKKFSTFILAVCLIFTPILATACNGPGGSRSGIYTLTVWAPAEEQGILMDMRDSFFDANPGYADVVRFEFGVRGMTDIVQDVIVDGARAANIFMFPSGAIPELGDNLLPINYAPLVQRVNEVHTQTALRDSSRNVGGTQTLFALPASPNNFVLHYNSSLLTADDVRSIDSILNATTSAQFNLAMPLTGAAGAWYNKAFFLTAGATLFGPNGDDPTASTFNGPEGMLAAQALVDLAFHDNFINDTGGIGGNLFRSGQLAAFFGPPISRNDVIDALGQNYASAPLPTITIDGQQVQMVDFSEHRVFGVNAQTGFARSDLMERAQVVRIALLFTEHITNTVNQMIRFERTAGAPTAAALLDPMHPQILARPEVVASIIQAEFNTLRMPTTPRLSAFWAPQGAFGNQIVNRAEASTPSRPSNTELQQWLNTLHSSITQ